MLEVYIGACLEHRLVFGGLDVWKLEHCRCTNAHLKVVSVDFIVCNV